MKHNDDLISRIEKLENRNKRVEADKAWETSWIRRGAIMALTYIVVAFYLHFVVHISPWINALVPVIGYTLSTLTVQQLKQRWLDQQKSKRTSKQG